MSFTTPAAGNRGDELLAPLCGNTGAPNILRCWLCDPSTRVSATAGGGIFNGLGKFCRGAIAGGDGALIAFTHSMDSGLIFLAVMAAVAAPCYCRC